MATPIRRAPLDPWLRTSAGPSARGPRAVPARSGVRTLGRVAYPDTVRLSTRCDRGPVAVRSHDEKMRPHSHRTVVEAHLSLGSPRASLGLEISLGEVNPDGSDQGVHALQPARPHNVLAQIPKESLDQVQLSRRSWA